MVNQKQLLLIEDEEDIASLVRIQAEISGYKLHVELDGINGLAAVKEMRPALVILDVMLPGMNGYDVCRQIKEDPLLKNIPVIMLSAKGKEIDVILGLELGADDYVPKPFSPKILFSRIKAVLRRRSADVKNSRVYLFGCFALNIETYEMKKNGKLIPLTVSEFGILKRLLINKGRVLTRNQLLDNLQNDDAFIVDRNIDVHIAALRKKLGPNFSWIETVRGVGYRLKEE